MALTPQDIHHKEFRSARFGGYNEEEVDSFLDLVADDFERMIHENTDIGQQLELVRKRIAEFEEMQTSLQSALLAATRSAEAIGEQARQEAEATVNKAQEEADSLIRGAQEQARQMTLRAQNERQKLERDFTRLRDIKRRYMDSLRQIAEGHLREVEDLEAREDAEPPIEEAARPGREQIPAPRPAAVPQEPQIEKAVLEEAPVAAPADVMIASETVAPEPEPPAPRLEGAPADEPRDAPPAVQPLMKDELPEPVRAPVVQAPVAAEAASPEKMPELVETVPGPAVSRTEEPATSAAPAGDGREAASEERVPSSQLVEEVLQLGADENPYADYADTDEEGVESEAGGRRNRKEKRDKHFFWE